MLLLIRMTLAIGVLLGGAVIDLRGDEPWSEVPGWSGAWTYNTDVTRTLGFDVAEGNSRIELNLQFFASREAAVQFTDKETIDAIEARFVRLQGGRHKMVAAGTWQDPDPNSRDWIFVVTRIEGAEFIWFGDQKNAFCGAEVKFIRGSDQAHDLLILDYSLPSFMKRRIAPRDNAPLELTTLAYRRNVDE